MIKQAAPQHPLGLTKLQHRLLYESDSESSFDFAFSSPSSVGSTSEYSDVGYQSSSRSRTSSHGVSRRAGAHGSSSRSESISSVLGASMAVQRVLMGTHPSTSNATTSSSRQSVRAIASAFEQAGRVGSMPPSRQMSGQLGRLSELNASIDTVQKSARWTSASRPSEHTSIRQGSPISSQASDSSAGRPAIVNNSSIPRLNVSKAPVNGPLSAPANITARTPQSTSSRPDVSEPAQRAPAFVFPPRSAPFGQFEHQIDRGASFDDDEPVFDIIPSPSRKRSEPFTSGLFASTTNTAPSSAPAHLSQFADTVDSDPVSSSLSAGSRDSMDSNYSFDSTRDQPFSLQLPGEDDRDARASSAASMQDLDELDQFRSPVIGSTSTEYTATPLSSQREDVHSHLRSGDSLAPSNIPVGDTHTSSRASAATLQPLLLSTSRPSSSASSSTTTLTPSGTVPTSMKVNDDVAFPLPPVTANAADSAKGLLTPAVVTRSRQPLASIGNTMRAPSATTADQSTIAELKREAAALLASITALGDEIDASVPPTHRRPGSASRSFTTTATGGKAGQTSFVAVDESFAEVWRCMDAWYWSSFEVAPTSAKVSR